MLRHRRGHATPSRRLPLGVAAVAAAVLALGPGPRPTGAPTSWAHALLPVADAASGDHRAPHAAEGHGRGTPERYASPAAGSFRGLFAPYVDMTLRRQDLAALSGASGARNFTLAFIVADNGCTPAWGGVLPVGSSQDYVGKAIEALRARGGSAIISFGGELGTELAEACPSVASLSAAYLSVISRYGAYQLDFDIEGGALWDTAGNQRRWDALARLQRQEARSGHHLEISVTLPVLPSGFPAPELEVLREAKAAGVALSIVNPMTMDYGGAVSSPGHMGTYAIQAARAVEGQLARWYRSRPPAERWAMLGITAMVGQNDSPGEVFTLADAAQVAKFAAQRGVGRLSMWSLSRDKECPGGPIDYDDPTCSGVLQSPWAFSHVFETG